MYSAGARDYYKEAQLYIVRVPVPKSFVLFTCRAEWKIPLIMSNISSEGMKWMAVIKSRWSV